MKRILIVDDEPPAREMVRTILAGHDYELREAEDGIAGLACVRAWHPDLVLSDVHMPCKDGFELLEGVRSDPATASTAFVLMTSKPSLQVLGRGFARGADGYLPKPFEVDALLSVIEQAWERSRLLKQRSDKRISALQARLLSTLSHEFLTPLNGILGVTELLGAGDFSKEEVASYVGILRESGERLHRMATNFLLCSDLEVAVADPVRQAFFKGHSALSDDQGILQTITLKAEQYNRALDLGLSLAPLQVAISAQYLSKILDEIMDNAFKFSKPDTSVCLTCSKSDGHALFSIRDQGVGMSPEEIAQAGITIGHPAVWKVNQGPGLGLVIVRHLLDLHGGSLEIAPGVSGGLQVLFRLPLKEVQ